MNYARRRTLKYLASSAGIPFVANHPRRVFAQDTALPIRIAVYSPEGDLLSQMASVTFKTLTAPAVTYDAKKSKHLYHVNLPKGQYFAEASYAGLFVKGQVTIDKPEIFHCFLGGKDWPSYRLGRHLIPYEAKRLEYITVVLEMTERWPVDLAADLHKELEVDGVVGGNLPSSLTPGSKPYLALNDSVFGIRLKNISQRAQARARIKEFLKVHRPDLILMNRVRIGMPVVTMKGAFRMLDGRNFVQFHENVADNTARDLISKAGAAIIRDHFIQSKNLFLVEFPDDDFPSHAQALQSWLTTKEVQSHEADVIAEMTWHAFPDDKPNDSLFEPADRAHPGQRVHLGDVQKISVMEGEGAWRWLKSKGKPFLGDPSVRIATLDTGIDPKHPDISINSMIACYDFSSLSANYPCTNKRYKPIGNHGTGVFALIGGNTNNSVCSAGIAPGASHIVLTIPQDLWHAQYYTDILLWAAGFSSPEGWPAVAVPSPGAGIINCSHGASYLPLSDLMSRTFEFVVQSGREGKGALIVYSVGNNGLPVSSVSTWAAHPKTMAVACSDLQGSKELIWSNSNYGPEVDICALGQNVVTAAPVDNNAFKLCSNDPKGGRYQIFGMTSSAAPMVSATAALVLSAKSDLPWNEIRDTLCKSADKIDCTNNSNERGWRAERYTSGATGITNCAAIAPPDLEWFSWGCGFGRLNALSAVKVAAP